MTQRICEAAGLTDGSPIMYQRPLVTAVIRDAASEPGALPLVSHVLLEICLHRRGDTLTLAGYEAAGGVCGALARSAEQVYTEHSHPTAGSWSPLATTVRPCCGTSSAVDG